MNPFRRKLIAVVTFLGGIYFFLTFLLPKKLFGITIDAYDEQILKAVQIVGVMSIGLGIINLVSIYGRAFIRERKNRWNAFALLVGFFVMFGILVVDLYESEQIVSKRQKLQALQMYLEQPISQLDDVTLGRRTTILTQALAQIEAGSTFQIETEETEFRIARDRLVEASRQALSLLHTDSERKNALQSAASTLLPVIKGFHAPYGDALRKASERSLLSKIQALLYEGFFVPLSSAIFALLAFYIATAAYRAFRIRTLESTVMMGTALLVILGQIPHGPLYISESLPSIRLWLLENVSTPAFRAIYFGSTIAGLAMAVRMWLSLEQPAGEGE